ncbi:MAG: hypothetical protein QXQ11_02020 [Candidatus Bathyarchaeia archaeon]
MDCDCVKRFRSMVEDRRSTAGHILEVELPRRLDTFTDAMRLGAIQLVARQLLRAGIFRASLDMNCSKNVSLSSAVEALRRVVEARPRLQGFLEKCWDIVVEQAVYINPDDVLPKRIRNRERLKETFGGYLDRSLDAAERLLNQLENLEARLPVWKSYVRGADTPRIDPIMDYHDSRK